VNVIYSGTVSAATEAAVLGVPSVAVSIDSFNATDFSAATEFIPKLILQLEQNPLPRGVSLNVNVPNVPASEVRGVRITHQGNMRCVESYDKRIDPRSNAYYWLCNTAIIQDFDPRSDSVAIAENCISVTPLHHDLTYRAALDTLEGWSL
jgi:5'-nucleotidase